MEEGTRRAPAFAVIDGALIGADAFLLRTVEIWRVGVACLLTGFDEAVIGYGVERAVLYDEWAVLTMEGLILAAIAFRAAEIGDNVRIAPASEAGLAPLVIVARMTANIDHAIDGR